MSSTGKVLPMTDLDAKLETAVTLIRDLEKDWPARREAMAKILGGITVAEFTAGIEHFMAGFGVHVGNRDQKQGDSNHD